MWSRKRSTLDVSYLNLRLCIGVLGVALPFILRIGSAIFPPDPYSVSAYYYSAMRNILVASLCVLGIFLLTYRGYDKLDSRITNVCGAATIGVALFPTSSPGFKPTWVGHVHPIVAGIALAGQALMALQFTQSAPRDGTARWLDDVKRLLRALVFRYAQRVYDEHGKKLTRNRIYSACAWLIIIGVVLALVQNFWPDSVKAETQWLFWFESLSIASFGFAWLVKGETLFKDAATPDQAVPVEAMPAQAVGVDATAAGGAAGVIYQTGERRLSPASATDSTPARRTRRLGRAEAVPNDVTACGERSFGRAHSGHRPCARNVPGLTRV